jgi:hypothetical protein
VRLITKLRQQSIRIVVAELFFSDAEVGVKRIDFLLRSLVLAAPLSRFSFS